MSRYLSSGDMHGASGWNDVCPNQIQLINVTGHIFLRTLFDSGKVYRSGLQMIVKFSVGGRTKIVRSGRVSPKTGLTSKMTSTQDLSILIGAVIHYSLQRSVFLPPPFLLRPLNSLIVGDLSSTVITALEWNPDGTALLTTVLGGHEIFILAK